MSCLTIVQDALVRIGLPSPSAAVGSSDGNASRMLALVNQEGKHLARRYTWQALVNEKTFTSVAQAAQTSAIPDGFDRFLPETMWNRTRNRLVSGPLTAREWQDIQGSSTTVVYDAFRQRGDSLLIEPTPTAGDTYAFEYVTKYWATDSDGTNAKAAFENDSDESLLDAELLTLGGIWRFLQSRGLDYGEAFRNYEKEVKTMTARDGGARVINMAKGGSSRSPRYPLFPDSNWDL